MEPKIEIDYDLLAAKVSAHVCENLKNSGYLRSHRSETIHGVTQDEVPPALTNGTLVKQRPAERASARR